PEDHRRCIAFALFAKCMLRWCLTVQRLLSSLGWGPGYASARREGWWREGDVAFKMRSWPCRANGELVHASITHPLPFSYSSPPASLILSCLRFGFPGACCLLSPGPTHDLPRRNVNWKTGWWEPTST
ncbi:unnamed protein product, partial [Phaeothamnion confervicola]